MRRRRRLTSVSTLRTVTNVSPRQIFAQQRFAAEDDAGVRREQMQQPELLIGQLDVAAVDADAAARRIDLDAVDRAPAAAGRRSSPRPRRRAAAAAAGAAARARARDQLADAERLGQVVVGAALEADHLVGLLAPRRQHQDRHVADSSRPLRTARQSDRPSSPGIITSSTSRSKRSRLGARQRRLAVADAFARIAFEAEVQAHQLADVRLVFDDEDARSGRHSFFTVRPCRVHRGPSNQT